MKKNSEDADMKREQGYSHFYQSYLVYLIKSFEYLLKRSIENDEIKKDLERSLKVSITLICSIHLCSFSLNQMQSTFLEENNHHLKDCYEQTMPELLQQLLKLIHRYEFTDKNYKKHIVRSIENIAIYYSKEKKHIEANNFNNLKIF